MTSANIGLAMVAALALATPGAAQTVYHYGFENLANGTSVVRLDLLTGADNTERLTGGSVGTPGVDVSGDFVARSGSKVYVGTGMDFVLTDPDCCSWEGVGAYVTGGAAITATAYAWDYDLADYVVFGLSQSTGGSTLGTPNFKLEFGSFTGELPALIVKVEFRSTETFAIDDIYYGGTVGIPEPASWALLIAGFGLTGAAMRRRRGLAGQRLEAWR